MVSTIHMAGFGQICDYKARISVMTEQGMNSPRRHFVAALLAMAASALLWYLIFNAIARLK
jgi:hypothetical protein